MMYMNTDTGVRYTLAELKQIWEQFGSESKHDTFEDMLNDLKEIKVVYRLIDLDSKHADEFGNTFKTKEEALRAFERAVAAHRVQGDEDSIIQLAVYEYANEDDDELECVDFDDANMGECIANYFNR